jgi:CheY-like chemotaxis protein
MFKRLFGNGNHANDYTIMVIDDDLPVRQTIVDILTEEGYNVLEAGNGAEGLEMLDKHGHPHAMIVDLMMPEMDGREFIARARVRHGKTGLPPILVLTAARHGEIEANLLEVDDFLPKPFEYDHLLHHVHQLITKNSLAHSG